MQGLIEKMVARLTPESVEYFLPLSKQLIALNPLLGKNIKLLHTGVINCVHCGRKISKSFNQGYCYPCFTTLAQCDMCIMKPETCHYAKGTCREPAWGEAFCFQPHFVYLANSSGIKVGITRQTQIPTRWIDQGAVQALPILKVASRQISGLVEVEIAKHVSDKTSWQKMLKSPAEEVDLQAERDRLLLECAPEIAEITTRFGMDALAYLPNAEVVSINFPVLNYPAKVKSFNFDAQSEVTGVLQGIKGQYLLLDTGVINMRKFTGYEIELGV
ncbi:MAG: DUF2797 domain-containing protein [Methylococcaceae bacterium]|nr:DUF2797 domain-containing protein [Methylococcaceae bacterium]